MTLIIASNLGAGAVGTHWAACSISFREKKFIMIACQEKATLTKWLYSANKFIRLCKSLQDIAASMQLVVLCLYSTDLYNNQYANMHIQYCIQLNAVHITKIQDFYSGRKIAARLIWLLCWLSKKNCTQKGAFSILGVSEFTPSTKNVHFFAYNVSE